MKPQKACKIFPRHRCETVYKRKCDYFKLSCENSGAVVAPEAFSRVTATPRLQEDCEDVQEEKCQPVTVTECNIESHKVGLQVDLA